jgi:hypothetical protein
MVENMIADLTNVLNQLSDAKAAARCHRIRAERAKQRKLDHRLMLITERVYWRLADLQVACAHATKAFTDFAEAIKSAKKHP